MYADNCRTGQRPGIEYLARQTCCQLEGLLEQLVGEVVYSLIRTVGVLLTSLKMKAFCMNKSVCFLFKTF
jgi:hypothetical protein